MFLYFRMQTQLQGLEELARQSRINYTTVVDTVYYDYFANMVCTYIYTLKTQFSEQGFSEILDLINKLLLYFHTYCTLYPDSI